jgi:hypothetical protein
VYSHPPLLFIVALLQTSTQRSDLHSKTAKKAHVELHTSVMSARRASNEESSAAFSPLCLLSHDPPAAES